MPTPHHVHLSLAQTLSKGWMQKTAKNLAWANGRKKKKVEEIKRWNILKGDLVEVVNGKWKGQSGKVQVVLRKNNRLIIEGVNVGKRMLYDKHDPDKITRPVDAPRSIHYSNVNLVCPITKKPTRVRRSFLEDGTKVRIAVRSGAVIPKPKFERTTPRSELVGEKDTLEEDVLEVTYNPERDMELWRTTMVDRVRHLELYDEE